MKLPYRNFDHLSRVILRFFRHLGRIRHWHSDGMVMKGVGSIDVEMLRQWCLCSSTWYGKVVTNLFLYIFVPFLTA